MKKLLLSVLIVFCILALSPLKAVALHWDIVREICIEDFVFIDRIRVPVGCEAIDCCPGCPGPEILDWRIRYSDDIFQSVDLAFSNLPEGSEQKLSVSDGIKMKEKGVYSVISKEAVIKGLPGMAKGRPPVASVSIDMDEDAVKRMREAGTDQDRMEYTVTIDQMLGPVIVNQFRVIYRFRICRPPVLRQDKVDLDNNTANDRAIVMLTGRRLTGCIGTDREFDNTTDVAFIGNMLSNGTCSTESVVFSDDNAMEIVSPTTVWTDSTGDRLPVPLDPMVAMPVSIWLVRAGAGVAANNDINNATFLYNDNNAGITFQVNTQDVSNNANAVNTITQNGRCSAANLNDIQGSAFYTANALNVYYVTGAFTAANCTADRLAVYVGNNANAASLAHEFGHSFSLFGTDATWGHTNTVPGFGNNNIMWGGGPGTRDHFSVGQVFRFNVDNDSSLNTTGARVGLTRDCPATTASMDCPALALDSLPH
jgi:hypothetical protein